MQTYIQDVRTPMILRGLLVLFFSLLALIGLHLAPSTFRQGWTPAVALVIVLGLVGCAMVQVLRSR